MNNIFKISFSLIFFLVINKNAAAQTPEPVFLASDRGMQKSEILKLQMRDDLKLTPEKFDSVLHIQSDFKKEQKVILMTKNIALDEKNKRLKAIAEKRVKAMKAAGLDDTETKRVESYFLKK